MDWEEIPYGSDDWCYWVALALAQHNHVMTLLVVWVVELKEEQAKLKDLALTMSKALRQILEAENARAADKTPPGISMYQ